jgi:uncharacterized cupredoxin-like copper-binding protein
MRWITLMRKGAVTRSPPMVAAASVLLVTFAVACGGSATEGDGDDAEVQPAEGPHETVGVRLVDFEIEQNQADVPAGTITFEVANDGYATDEQGERIPTASGGMHNLHVLRTDLPPDDLPHQRANALIVDVESPQIEDVGWIPTLDDGARESLTLDLAPGAYVLICNLNTHYARGMWARLSVS